MKRPDTDSAREHALGRHRGFDVPMSPRVRALVMRWDTFVENAGALADEVLQEAEGVCARIAADEHDEDGSVLEHARQVYRARLDAVAADVTTAWEGMHGALVDAGASTEACEAAGIRSEALLGWLDDVASRAVATAGGDAADDAHAHGARGAHERSGDPPSSDHGMPSSR